MNKTVLAKIKKCLALARSANEHEAATALAKACELMDQHGIDEEDIGLGDVAEAIARASRTIKPPLWEGMLSATVCHAVGVRCLINRDGDRVFVGVQSRAEIAGYAFSVLFRQLARAGRLHQGAAQALRPQPEARARRRVLRRLGLRGLSGDRPVGAQGRAWRYRGALSGETIPPCQAGR
jgi:hypothetical protein